MEKRGRKLTKHLQRRLTLIRWFGDVCHDCSGTFPHYIYEFHHRNPKEKEFTLSGKDMNRTWEKIAVEAEKCDMLCANCHKERHYNDGRKTAEKENDFRWRGEDIGA